MQTGWLLASWCSHKFSCRTACRSTKGNSGGSGRWQRAFGEACTSLLASSICLLPRAAFVTIKDVNNAVLPDCFRVGADVIPELACLCYWPTCPTILVMDSAAAMPGSVNGTGTGGRGAGMPKG